MMSNQQGAQMRPNSEPTAGEHGTRQTDLFDYDAELRLHNELFRAAARVGSRDRVLDIGCGTGQSTREAARAAVTGSAVGVDLSAPMLERARRLSDDQGLPNITYQQADAQVHRFPPPHFDLCISRFGAMFFADPVAAFTNIGRALRPGARLVLLVWQDRDRNEWATAIRQTLTADTQPLPPAVQTRSHSPTRPSRKASWRRQASRESASPTCTSPSSTARTPPPPSTTCSAYGNSRDLLAGLDAATAEQARTRLRATLAAHNTDSGVYFDSRAWIVTARRH